MMRKKIYRLKIKQVSKFGLSKFGILFILSVLLSSCTYRSFDEPKSNINAVDAAKNMSELEKEVEAMKTADFDYIFTFKRMDDGVFTSEDKQFIKANSHFATNRFTLTKDEKVIVAGSNFAFSQENLDALQDRFKMESFSKPPEELEKQMNEQEKSNNNTNINQNK